MKFEFVDVSNWARKEYFDRYLNITPCSYSMTLNLDITGLIRQIKHNNIKLYPVTIYLLSKIVNKYEEFRTAIDENGNVGLFDWMSPMYTIFQKDTGTFTSIWTEYCPNFSEFYQNYMIDIQTYSSVKQFLAKSNPPANIFTISSIPWVNFSGFNLNLPKATSYLLPIFTTGKYFEQNDKIWLPIAIQVHHAVCDGFHIARFVNELQEAITQFKL